MTRIGQRRHRVDIDAPSYEQGAMGNTLDNWMTIGTVWARAMPQSGKEFVEAAKTVSDMTFMWNIRYRSDITTQHRLIHDGRPMNIIAVIDPEERHIELNLLCGEAS